MRKKVTILKPALFNTAWWERYPERANLEAKQMHKETNARRNFIDGQMVWEETICNTFGTIFKLSIVCQKNHPFDTPRA